MKFPLLQPLRRNGVRLKPPGQVELDPKADQGEIVRLVLAGVIRDVRPSTSGDGDQGGTTGEKAPTGTPTEPVDQAAGQALDQAPVINLRPEPETKAPEPQVKPAAKPARRR